MVLQQNARSRSSFLRDRRRVLCLEDWTRPFVKVRPNLFNQRLFQLHLSPSTTTTTTFALLDGKIPSEQTKCFTDFQFCGNLESTLTRYSIGSVRLHFHTALLPRILRAVRRGKIGTKIVHRIHSPSTPFMQVLLPVPPTTRSSNYTPLRTVETPQRLYILPKLSNTFIFEQT